VRLRGGDAGLACATCAGSRRDRSHQEIASLDALKSFTATVRTSPATRLLSRSARLWRKRRWCLDHGVATIHPSGKRRQRDESKRGQQANNGMASRLKCCAN